MEPIYRPVISLAFATFRALDLRFDIHGAEHLPRVGGAVLAITHFGYLDFALAGAATWLHGRRYVRFMAKAEVWAHPVAGPLMRGMHHIPVDRGAGAGALGHAVSALRAGELVGVFPEGTVSQSFTVQTLKTGAVRMAAAAGVPLVPVAIWGSQRVLTKGRRRDLRAARHTPIGIHVGEHLHPDAGEDPVEGTARLRGVLASLLDSAWQAYPDRPRPGEACWWMPAHLGGTAPTPEAAEAVARAAAARRRRGAAAGAARSRARSGHGPDGALPALPAVPARPASAADGEAEQPHREHDHREHPQRMHREAHAPEQKCDQEHGQNQTHEDSLG